MADRRGAVPAWGGLSLAATRARAFAALLLERLWPLAFALLCLAALFLTLAWFGVFAALPGWGRIGLLLPFAGGIGWALWRARHVRLPTGREVAGRIERESLLLHRPLSAQGEAALGGDPFALALWREHQKRMAERLGSLRAGPARGRTERLDPYALRAVLALFLVTGFAYSFGPNGGRVMDAFRAVEGTPVASARVDAWVTPPAYTGQAPVFLASGGEAVRQVPAGSILSIRVSDNAGVALVFTPESGAAPQDLSSEAEGAGEYEFALARSGTARLETRFRTLGQWRFAVVPDLFPSIQWEGEPREARNGALELHYRVMDDHGVVRGNAEIALREERSPEARALIEPPEINLSLPRRARGEGRGRTNVNLAESPYAGARVAMTLRVADDAGQTGRSETLELTLPERRFSNPLARAVVEQRRILALDANAAPRVVEMLDAVTLHGDSFIERPGDYIALRAVRSRIANARGDETLLSAVDFLWQIALGIEDGQLSFAEQRLRDAQEALAEALEEGASDEEIAALMEELRAAMQKFMQAMAEAMQDRPPMDPTQLGDLIEIRPQDLERMMDRIEDLARSGSREAAQELLAELQAMMNSLQAMQNAPQQGGEQSEAQQRMNEAGEILQRQQDLMNQTFELGREEMNRRMGEEGAMSEEEIRQRMEELQAEQEALQEQLQALQDAMEEMGMEPSEGFGEAGESMGEAAGALGEGEDGTAMERQSDAMEALRRGAADMMSQMQAMGPGGQARPGQQGQGYGPGQQRSGRDPLGRQRPTNGPDFGQDVEVPDEIDAQRARRILDQIRERLGDRLSPQLEREYLERLLRTP